MPIPQALRSPRRDRRGRNRGAWAILLLGLSACERTEPARYPFLDLTPHEAYAASLTEAGLAGTTPAREWLRAGEAALAAPAPVTLPFVEEGWLPVEDPAVMAYRLSVPAGQKLTAAVALSGEDRGRLFVDLFRLADDGTTPFRPVVATDDAPGAFTHEPWRGGDFVLRLQPELLKGGRYRVEIRLESQLAFPLDGYDIRALQSIFGAARDGGARSHEGVDLFARRGTPVLAAAPGRAYRIGVTNLGGKVVWVRDNVSNARLYYAHLDSQAVVEGQIIAVGDTLGFVGNTGNARTTPPHLHFGVYRGGQGAVDPTPYLRPPRQDPPALTVDLERLGSWVRAAGEGIRLRSGPQADAPVLQELDPTVPGRVLGGAGAYYRLALPDGAQGYVASRLTEPSAAPAALPEPVEAVLVQQ